MLDPIELTRSLLGYDTTNPPGQEAECGRFLAAVLSDAGFDVTLQDFAPGRLNVIARSPGSSDGDPLVLTGHIDTVPLGAAAWSHDPFAGEVSQGRLYGRGVSDMKAGVAAMVAAAGRFSKGARGKRGVTLIFTSGEETGCAGALALADASPQLIGTASAMLVGEPTGNRISTGHKGCVALRATASGLTAHSSMPDKGRNAIYAAAAAINRIAAFTPSGTLDPLLGSPTKNVGMIEGGLNYNSVPDHAAFTVDVRTVPGMSHDDVERQLVGILGPEITTERFVDMPAVGISPDDPFLRVVEDAAAQVLGPHADLSPLGIPFFSDASVFHPLLGCPTIIYGPGEPALAHQTDEWCTIEKISQCVEVYSKVIASWCGA